MLGLRLDYGIPQLLGVVELKMKSSEVKPRMRLRAIDSWEGYFFFDDFTFDSLKKYLKAPKHVISDTAKLTILLALINKFGFEKVEENLQKN